MLLLLLFTVQELHLELYLLLQKKVNQQKRELTFKLNLHGVQPIMLMDPIDDPYQYAKARNVANIRTNGAPSYDDDYLAAAQIYSNNPTPENAWYRDGTDLIYVGYNDFKDMYLKDWTPQQRHNLSVSGSTDKSNYYVSLGFLEKKGWIENDDIILILIGIICLAKVSYEVTDWLEMDTRHL